MATGIYYVILTIAYIEAYITPVLSVIHYCEQSIIGHLFRLTPRFLKLVVKKKHESMDGNIVNVR